jgi:hypothetical protein
MVLPPLADLLRDHPVQLEVRTPTPTPSPACCAAGAADFIFTGKPPARRRGQRAGRPRRARDDRALRGGPTDVYLDSGVNDQTTCGSSPSNPPGIRPRRWRRAFLHNEAGILLGVELGLGRAVKPARPSRRPRRSGSWRVPAGEAALLPSTPSATAASTTVAALIADAVPHWPGCRSLPSPSSRRAR